MRASFARPDPATEDTAMSRHFADLHDGPDPAGTTADRPRGVVPMLRGRP